MSKRLFIVALSMVLLAGCAAVVEPSDYATHTTYEYTTVPLMLDPVSQPPLNMAGNPTSEFMAQFNTVHEFALEGDMWSNITVLFWADEPLRDVSLFSYRLRHNLAEGKFFRYDTLFTIDELLPSEAFVLQHQARAILGLSFVDKNGEQQYVHLEFEHPGGNLTSLDMYFLTFVLPDWPWCDHCDDYCYENYLYSALPPTPLNVVYAPTDEFMAQFENTQTITFERPSFFQEDYTRIMAFWTDEPLREFSYVGIYPNWMSGGEGISVRETRYIIGDFAPGEALVFVDWYAPYQHPTAGFAFINQNGEQRYIYISQSMIGGCFPSITFIYFQNTPPNN